MRLGRWLILLAACGPSEPDATCDASTPWVRHTIHAGHLGADAVAFADLDGDNRLDVAAGWELSGVITLSLQPDDVTSCRPWPSVSLPANVGSVEDVLFADVDHDGRVEVVSISEVGGLYVHFPPADSSRLLDRWAWTSVQIEASLGTQRWMQGAFADVDRDGIPEIVAGGRGPAAAIGYFTAFDPHAPAGWVFHEIGPVGWLMSLEPRDVDLDGDIDLVVSDRLRIDGAEPRYDLIGSRWLEHEARAWTNHTIYHPHDEGQPKFLHSDPTRVIDGSSAEGINVTTVRTTTNWINWTSTPIPQPPGVGQYHDVEPGDLDGDGIEDLVFSYSNAGDNLSGVVALVGRPDGWVVEDISGPAGTKFDNVMLLDMDADGDLDVVTSEQIEELGVIWYANPLVGE